MEKDIGTTLLYIFLAMLQIYILFLVGLISALNKVFTTKSIKAISELLVNFFLPVYACLELARMSSWPNVEIMWILIVSVFIAILSGFYIGKFIHYFFKLDVRFKRSFPYLMSFPSLGTLPLVLGRALCYPGGMLEGDPNCASMLGFMMMNFLVFQMMLFVMGFTLMPQDANFSNSIMDKMSYIWHNLIGKIFEKNYSVFYIFKKFMKDEKRAEELFEVFHRKYKLEMIDNENLSYNFTENREVALDFPMDLPHFELHPNRSFPKMEVIEEEPINKDQEVEQHDSYFHEKSLSQHDIEILDKDKDVEQATITQRNYTEKNEIMNTQCDLLPDLSRPVDANLIRLEVNDKINEEINEDNGESNIKQLPIGDEGNPEEFHFSREFNYVQSELVDIDGARADSIHTPKKMMPALEEKQIRKVIELRRKSSFQLFSNDVEVYYQKVFGFVDKHLNENKEQEYEEYKLSIMKSIYGVPPRFPTVKYIELNNDMVEVIEDEWIKFEKSIKKIKTDFHLVSAEIPLSLSVIINKVHSPPIIGCFLGLLIGMSGMRDVLFSSNHYISNLVEGISVVTRSTVPFLYIVLGISMLSIKGINFMNTPLTKKYVIITFVLRFIILPGIGLFYVYMWQTYYGGVVEASKVFRMSLFIPFCLPATATVVVIVNIIKYFSDETGLILFAHNVTLVFTLTILYLIYYIAIG